jgi:hypothetical protein
MNIILKQMVAQNTKQTTKYITGPYADMLRIRWTTCTDALG